MFPFPSYPCLGVVEELTETVEVAIRINSLLQPDKSLNLALVAPIVLGSIVRPLAIVLIDVLLVVTGDPVEELLVLNEPIIDQSAIVSVEVSGLEDSGRMLVRES